MESRLKPTDPPFGFLFSQLPFKESLPFSAIQNERLRGFVGGSQAETIRQSREAFSTLAVVHFVMLLTSNFTHIVTSTER